MLVQDYVIIIIVLAIIASIVAATMAGILSLSKSVWAQLIYTDYATTFVAMPTADASGLYSTDNCPRPAWVFDFGRMNTIYEPLFLSPIGNILHFRDEDITKMNVTRAVFCTIVYNTGE